MTSDESLLREMPEATPLDKYNRALIANVHPIDWVNPVPAECYNLVVIGAGTAGLVAAAGAASLGAKVALVEKRLMGGDCLNVGCVPSKALIRTARAVAEVRDAGCLGVKVPEGVEVDFPGVMERMRRLRSGLSTHDSARRFRELGIDVFIGAASFEGPDRVSVDGKTLRFSKAVIATGARASELPIPGLAETGYLTNESVFSLTELPKRLAVIGAGPIGCELSQAFARFGSEVYLVESSHGILPQEDRDGAEIVYQAMRRDGVQLMCCGQELEIKKNAGGKRLTVDSHGSGYDLTVDEILVAAGRTPNVEGLGLETAGVVYDKYGIKVNDYLQTTNPRIFAAGDICFRYKFTHTADAMARIVIRNALFGFVPFIKAKVSVLTIPWCTYTDPEIAHVGMYPKDAEEKGIDIDTYTVELAEVDRAVLDGEDEGFLKVYVRKNTDRILGATLVAGHAGEMISEVTLAIVNKIGLGKFSETIHPYPTQAEIFRKAGDLYNRSRLTKRAKRTFTKLMAWQR